jgi:hypothetical protein
MTLLCGKRLRRTLADFNSFNLKLPCVTFLPFEDKFKKVYTLPNSKKFSMR